MSHRLGKTGDAILAARFGVELDFELSKAERPSNVLADRKVSRQRWLSLHEAISGCSFSRLRLRRHGIVAGADHGQTRRDNDRDIAGGPIGGVIMKRKPAR